MNEFLKRFAELWNGTPWIKEALQYGAYACVILWALFRFLGKLLHPFKKKE